MTKEQEEIMDVLAKKYAAPFYDHAEAYRFGFRAGVDSEQTQNNKHLNLFETVIRHSFKEREDKLIKRVAGLVECLKDIIRNSHDIIAKKRCSEALTEFSQPEDVKE